MFLKSAVLSKKIKETLIPHTMTTRVGFPGGNVNLIFELNSNQHKQKQYYSYLNASKSLSCFFSFQFPQLWHLPIKNTKHLFNPLATTQNSLATTNGIAVTNNNTETI